MISPQYTLSLITLAVICFNFKLATEIISKGYSGTNIFQKEKRLFPACRVILLNQKHNYHYEVLESIVAQYPFYEASSACDHSAFHFTVAIASGEEKEFYLEKSLSWYEYATTNMSQTEYVSSDDETSRRLDGVIRNSSTSMNVTGFDYQIRASCYCESDDDIEWLYESDTHFCVFHEDCGKAKNVTRALWLNPKIQPSFFPDFLPAFEHERSFNSSFHNLCIVGEGKRREYDLLAYYLRWKEPEISKLHFHHFGIGNVQKPMKPFQKLITLHPYPNFLEYQLELYEKCDAILSLVTRFQHPEYFKGSMKLSGSLVQASAYRKPILLHQDLADTYKEHLVETVTHEDDADSFVEAFEKLIRLLSDTKALIIQNRSAI